MNFHPTADQRWMGIMEGFVATLHQLKKNRLISSANYTLAIKIEKRYKKLKTKKLKEGDLAVRMTECCKRHGLYKC